MESPTSDISVIMCTSQVFALTDTLWSALLKQNTTTKFPTFYDRVNELHEIFARFVPHTSPLTPFPVMAEIFIRRVGQVEVYTERQYKNSVRLVMTDGSSKWITPPLENEQVDDVTLDVIRESLAHPDETIEVDLEMRDIPLLYLMVLNAESAARRLNHKTTAESLSKLLETFAHLVPRCVPWKSLKEFAEISLLLSKGADWQMKLVPLARVSREDHPHVIKVTSGQAEWKSQIVRKNEDAEMVVQTLRFFFSLLTTVGPTRSTRLSWFRRIWNWLGSVPTR